MAKNKTNTSHIFAGGAVGEWGYCSHCGDGLTLGDKPQPFPIVMAAISAFTKMHSKCKKTWVEPEAKNIAEWTKSRFVGVSSFTIAARVFGYQFPYERWDVPHDYADFARCVKLLALPLDMFNREKGDSNEEIFLKSADLLAPDKWRRIISNWTELKRLFDAATITGDSSEFYAYLSAL